MFGIYIHIPFCEKKCFYCDFYSIEKLNLIDDFVSYLQKEIDLRLENLDIDNKKVTSIFFGGGTPSLLTAKYLEKIFRKLSKYFNIDNNVEITIESNPGTLKLNKLIDYKAIGINRLSIGVQSFNDDELKFLQRIHNSEQVLESYKNAREAKFDNINLDIIFSIPGQDLSKINHTISQLKILSPEHISAYSLIYEPGTALSKMYKTGKIIKINDDLDADIYLNICKELNKSGFEHYEVSNFAKKDKQCLHNLTYWGGYNYIGFGPSAHSFIDNKRFWNVRNIKNYIDKIISNELPIKSSENLTTDQKIAEKLMLSLRASGLKLQNFQDEFGIDILKKCNYLVDDWIVMGYCTKTNGTLKLTDKGYFVSDTLISSLLNSL